MENFYNHLENIVSLLKTYKRIVIVGKGGSLAQIDELSLHDAFIININDSERYISGHVTLFHSEWVIESLRKEGPKNKFYVTPQPITSWLSKERIHIPCQYFANSNEDIEHIAASFNTEEFVLGDFLLLSAIHLTHRLLTSADIQLPVYLIGFDFEYAENSSIADLSGHDIEYKKILLRTQRESFKFIKKYVVGGLGMKLLHVGQSEVSDLSVDQFNVSKDSEKQPPFFSHKTFDNRQAYQQLILRCKEENYTLVVAELTNNHIGDAHRLRQMIQAAKKCGADMIKVQKRDIETFYTSQELATYYDSPFGKTLGDYRRGVELNDDLMEVLMEECELNEIVWFASILDYPSLQFIERYDAPIIKLPSTISNHKNFLKRVADEYKEDLVISTGFTDASYEDFVIETFTGNRHVFLLQCTSSYPAPPEACQIAVVRHYEEMRVVKNVPQLFSGYSSHDLGSLGSMMAVAAGARMVEKHVKYGNLEWIHFDGVALDLSTNEFELFVKDIRKAQKMCGTKQKQIHTTEHHKYSPNEKHN